MRKQKKQLTIYVVRHGEAEFNVKGIFGGTYEPNPLTPKGIYQAHELAQKFKDTKLDKIYSSDLSRAKKTAEIIAAIHNLSVETTPLLRERSYGRLQGMTFEKGRRQYKAAFAKEANLKSKKALKFKYVEDMESLHDAVSRFKQFLKVVANNQKGKTILIVSHFDIMIGYLIDIGFGIYQELINAELDHTGYFKLVDIGETFQVKEIIGLDTL